MVLLQSDLHKYKKNKIKNLNKSNRKLRLKCLPKVVLKLENVKIQINGDVELVNI